MIDIIITLRNNSVTGYLVHWCAAILVTQFHIGIQATEVLDDVPMASGSGKMEGSPVGG